MKERIFAAGYRGEIKFSCAWGRLFSDFHQIGTSLLFLHNAD
ncbi:unnamed protein product [Spirodela intermedia]|uniref:Uncharacterized protein n=2 Tax=Spirodela intermedia TaxID=51605 RepID=A0A7I8K2E7_SPIIN|nr:unnamed protein product [Spirodela intermedia]CAA6655824.1 unnamed protein product [Spirodela intermedia]CAA7391192.1 unnamed protein product [Spirodela intermedia]